MLWSVLIKGQLGHVYFADGVCAVPHSRKDGLEAYITIAGLLHAYLDVGKTRPIVIQLPMLG